MPHSVDEIVNHIARHLRRRRTPWHRLRKLIPHTTVRWEPGSADIHFLAGAFTPLEDEPPDVNLVTDLLRQAADGDAEASTRLLNLWMALRHLCAAHYTNADFNSYLRLWEHAFSLWGTVAAWYGLHGHLYLGRLAAVNSMSFVQQRMARLASGDTATSFSLRGESRASEFLSIARMISDRTVRRRLLLQALAEVNRALQAPTEDPSGLLGIRGTVKQNLGLYREGLDDYRHMLQFRTVHGESTGRIGETEAELGFGYLRCCRPYLAERHLTRGVRLLEQSDRHPFTVRALRKLSILYLLTVRPIRARQVIERANTIASRFELYDQSRQMRLLRCILRWIPMSMANR